VFLYCGHNAGEQYVRREDVRQVAQCKVALLMGCSSVLMETNGDYEPSGSVLSYMLADWYGINNI
jgi:separase